MAVFPYTIVICSIPGAILLVVGLLFSIQRTRYWLSYKAGSFCFCVFLGVCLDQASYYRMHPAQRFVETKHLPDFIFPGFSAQNWFLNALAFSLLVAAFTQLLYDVYHYIKK
jgi:hypothetical protein